VRRWRPADQAQAAANAYNTGAAKAAPFFMPITSPQNRKLKEIAKLVARRDRRERAGRFVAAGEDLLAAADAAGWEALERYCAAGSGLAGVEVEPELLARASGLESGTRALAVYQERFSQAPVGPLCVHLHGVRDPGNLGTILRAAHAFGGSCVSLGAGCADPFAPKAVRASMGAVFAVALARGGPLPGRRIALVPGAGVVLAEVGRAGSEVTVMLGAEREGLPRELVDGADVVAHIPISGDSLNVAMAAAVALYELSRMARA
jgi:TrmH family RNA methyltransferase